MFNKKIAIFPLEKTKKIAILSLKCRKFSRSEEIFFQVCSSSLRGITKFKEVIRAPSLLFAAGRSLCGSKIMEPRSGVGGRSEVAFPAFVAETVATEEAVPSTMRADEMIP